MNRPRLIPGTMPCCSCRYRWNLFDHPRSTHPSSAATEAGHVSAHIKQRDLVMMKCWDMNIATFVPSENYFFYPACRGHVASPCTHSVPAVVSLQTGISVTEYDFDVPPAIPNYLSNNLSNYLPNYFKGWPARPDNVAPARWFQPEHWWVGRPAVSLHLANVSESCVPVCSRLGKMCSQDSMLFANDVPLVEAQLGDLQCTMLVSQWGDDGHHPSVDTSSGMCTMRSQQPVCAAVGPKNFRRICGCGANSPDALNVMTAAIQRALSLYI